MGVRSRNEMAFSMTRTVLAPGAHRGRGGGAEQHAHFADEGAGGVDGGDVDAVAGDDEAAAVEHVERAVAGLAGDDQRLAGRELAGGLGLEQGEQAGHERSPEAERQVCPIARPTGSGPSGGPGRQAGRQAGACRRAYLSSPILRAAMKASWGISTLPNWRMRFLPAFCFSSSLRLRVMSPP